MDEQTAEKRLDHVVRTVLGEDFDLEAPLAVNRWRAMESILRDCAHVTALAVAQRQTMLQDHVDKLAHDLGSRISELETSLEAAREAYRKLTRQNNSGV